MKTEKHVVWLVNAGRSYCKKVVKIKHYKQKTKKISDDSPLHYQHFESGTIYMTKLNRMAVRSGILRKQINYWQPMQTVTVTIKYTS